MTTTKKAPGGRAAATRGGKKNSMEKISTCPTTDNPEVVLQKNAREQYRLAVERYHGHACVDLRVFYEDDDSGEYKPSRKGLCIRLERWSAFRAALSELEEQLQVAGLLDDVEEDGGDV